MTRKLIINMFITNLLVYLLVSYVRWEIYNPLPLIKSIPSMDYEQRFGFLFTILIYNGCNYYFNWIYLNRDRY